MRRVGEVAGRPRRSPRAGGLHRAGRSRGLGGSGRRAGPRSHGAQPRRGNRPRRDARLRGWRPRHHRRRGSHRHSRWHHRRGPSRRTARRQSTRPVPATRSPPGSLPRWRGPPGRHRTRSSSVRSPPPASSRRPSPGRREPRAAFRPRQLGSADELAVPADRGRGAGGTRRRARRRRAGVEPHRAGASRAAQPADRPGRGGRRPRVRRGAGHDRARRRPAGGRGGPPDARAPRRPEAPRRQGGLARPRSAAGERARWRRPPSAPRSASRTWRASPSSRPAGSGASIVAPPVRSTSRATSTSSPPRRWRSCAPARSRSSTCPPRSRCSRRRRVPVVGLGVDEMPAFYSIGSGLRLSHRVDSARDAAAAIRAHRALPGAGGIVIAQPAPAELALDAAEVEGWIADGLVDAEANGIHRRGRDAAPARVRGTGIGRARAAREHRPHRQQRASRGRHRIGLDLTNPGAMLTRPVAEQAEGRPSHANLRRKPAPGLGRRAAQHRRVLRQRAAQGDPAPRARGRIRPPGACHGGCRRRLGQPRRPRQADVRADRRPGRRAHGGRRSRSAGQRIPTGRTPTC